MSTYQLDIDGSGAEAGADRIVKSFDSIKAAADRMEGGVTAAAKKASSSFAEIQRNARPVSESAISTLKALSSVLSSFRAPSDAAVRNTIIFLQGLKSVGSLNLGRVTGLGNLLSVIAGYRGPTQTAGRNTLAVLNALRFASTYSTPRGLAPMLAALSSFRGPSAAAARNVLALLTALNSFKAAPGLSATVRALEKVVLAANSARNSLNSLKSAGPRTINIKANTKDAERGFGSLLKTNNLLQTSLLRTQTAWNALGGILAAKLIINASNDMIKINAQLGAATGSAAQAAIQFQFVRDFAEKMGLDVRTAAQSFGFFLGSVKGTNLTLKESRDIFAGFSTAARALQLSTEDVDGVFRALGQMMSKGKIQAEELRGQLGDRLPGAFARFAVALHMTRPGELDQALKKGTISADKMKQGIIDVAKELSAEFAPSAAQMANTVDAAFNRLKNAFFFAASDLGKSGLNQALIEIANTATKLLQSTALDRILRVLGGTFKFIGDHINAFVNIVGTLALSSTLKWVASLVGLRTATEAATTATVAANVATEASIAVEAEAAVATGVLSRAWVTLTTVMKANPFIFIAAVIVGVITLLDQFSNSAKANLDEVQKNTGSLADTESIYQQYINNVMASKNALDKEAQSFRENTVAAVNNARAKLGQIHIKEYSGVHVGWDGGFTTRPVKTIHGSEVGAYTQRFYHQFYDSQGNYKQIQNGADYMSRIQAGALARQNAGKPGWEGIENVARAVDLDVTNVRDRAAIGQNVGFDPDKLLQANKYTRGWQNQMAGGAGITGTMISKPTKQSHKKSDAQMAAEDVASAVDSALKGLGDLEVKARATADTIDGLLSGSFDKYTAAAHKAALEQEKNFEDQIKGHGKVSEAQAQAQAVLQLAGKLQGQGKIGADVDISSYDKAKAAVIGYMEAMQSLDAQRKRDEEVANNVAEMRDQNNITENAIALLGNRKNAQADVNKETEIENQLLGTSAEERPKLRAELEKEIDRRNALAALMQLTNDQRDRENKQAVDSALSPMYKSGMRQEDIDYYQEMLQYRQKIVDEYGANNPVLQGMLNEHAATLNEDRVMKQLTDHVEQGRQAAADMADAIVGGFRDGLEAGQSFLDIFKNIFKQITKIIMDFVLYNPMKQWLTQAIGGITGQISTQGFGGVGTPNTGTVNAYSTGGGIIQSIVGSVVQQLSGTGYNPAQGGFIQNVNPVGQSVAGGRGYVDSNGDLVFGGSGGSGNIVVTGVRDQAQPTMSPTVIPQANKQLSFFTNFMNTMKASQDGFKAFTSMVKSGKITGAGVQGAIGAAGTAFAMYQTGDTIGKSLAKAIGGGFRTQAVAGGILGGAAAGYSLGGPIGAAIGAVIGGVIGFLKKKPLIPSSYGTVTVGSNGVAVVGTTGTHGNADPKVGLASATAGASLFNNFALTYGGMLSAGNYGAFGQRMFDPAGPGNKGMYSFWSSKGIGKDGKPAGVEGKDWIYGSESEVQAFALLKEIRDGMIKGLSDTIMTVAKNTKATTMEGLQADLGIGQAFDQFVKGSYVLTDVASKVSDLNDAFNKLKAQATALGLSEDKLSKARQRLMNNMKDEFNYTISQGILGYTNPAQAQFNDLVKEYHDAVESAMAVGGDLTAVEDYYGRKRADLAKQWADIATNGLASAARDLYNSLTASSASPLNAGTVLRNSKDLYGGLVTQFQGGDFSNVDKLDTYAQNYLDAARQMYGSSTDYFDIFKTVTDQLNQFQNGQGLGGLGGSTTPPDLPSLDSIVQEINSQSLDMIDSIGTVGQAVVEGSTSIVDAINNLAIALGQNIPAPTPSPGTTPTGPSTGGTGVGSTGGVAPSGGGVTPSGGIRTSGGLGGSGTGGGTRTSVLV